MGDVPKETLKKYEKKRNAEDKSKGIKNKRNSSNEEESNTKRKYKSLIEE